MKKIEVYSVKVSSLLHDVGCRMRLFDKTEGTKGVYMLEDRVTSEVAVLKALNSA